MPPSSNLASRPERSTLPSRDRNVSAIARRSRCAEHLLLAALLADLELDLAAQRADHGGQVAHPGDRRLGRPVSADRRTADAAAVSAAAIANRAETPERASTAGDSRTSRVNRAITSTRWSGELRGRPDVGLLLDQGELVGQRQRVVGADLGAEPVLQRRDDPAPVGVVLRVGAGHEQQVERQPQRVAADADVALLQHVQQRDLDPLGEVGQLVQGEDAAVGPRHQAEVDGLRVAEGAALGHLDRVDVADQVADAGVRGGELLAVPVVAVPPADRQVVAQLRGEPAAPRAGRLVRDGR